MEECAPSDEEAKRDTPTAGARLPVASQCNSPRAGKGRPVTTGSDDVRALFESAAGHAANFRAGLPDRRVAADEATTASCPHEVGALA